MKTKRMKPTRSGSACTCQITNCIAPIHQIASREALQEGFVRVARAGGGPGRDRQTIADFAGSAGRNLAQLSREILLGTYKPRLALKRKIAKPDGGTRGLAIPAVRDRIIQSTVAAELDRRLDHAMSEASFAYRKGLSVEHALSLVTFHALRGYRHVVDGDIRNFFDEVPHAGIMAMLEGFRLCPETSKLISQWLAGHNRKGRGLPQGSPISPILSNLFLAPFDQQVETAKTKLVRYADDFLILVRSREAAEAALASAGASLSRLGLELNMDKTRLAHLDNGVRFLGAEIRGASISR